MPKVVVATTNKHKLKEIESIIGNDFDVIGINDYFHDVEEIVEDGSTFTENAIKKIENLPAKKDVIYLADDSGIEVDGLNGRPGISSARYAGEKADYKTKCQTIFDELGSNNNLKANFTCVIALKFPNGKIKTVEGKVFGTISQKMIGSFGFGYDPIFIPDGYDITFGQMTEQEKNKLSHRGKALILAKELLNKVN